MDISEKHKMYPIKHYVKMLLVISFITLILDVVISFASIVLVQQQSSRYLQNSADLYIDRINSSFSYINHFMGWTLANDKDVELLNDHNSTDTEFIEAKLNLYQRFSELQKSHGKEYNFFIFIENKSFLQNVAPMNITYSKYEALKAAISEQINAENLYEKFYSQWTTIGLNGTDFIINIVPYDHTYLISLVSPDELIQPLREINLGENGFVSLISEQEKLITKPLTNNDEKLSEVPQRSQLMKLLHVGTTVDREFSNASFYVKLVIQFGAFEKIMIAQLLVVLLAVIIACSLSFVMLYFQKKVLKPIKKFSNNLSLLMSDGEPIDFTSSKIMELEKANRQFVDLVKQIKNIKITLYERELEKQSIQLNYMKLQINPHFFLNCLTTIYSMAQMQMYKEIENMTLSTSKYFRYIFQHDQDFVSLNNELEHVSTYLEIQRQRYQNAFDYRIEKSVPTDELQIPPLVLQTFIENAVKYAVSRDKKTEVSLIVTERIEAEEIFTVIRIADNGPGFPVEVLEKLNNGQPLDQSRGTHIGIMNTIERLTYLYHKKARVMFSNSKDSGACVSLYLPKFPDPN